MSRIFLVVLFLTSLCWSVFAAIGCSLDDPDRDVKRLFPDSSGYTTTFVTLKERGGEALQKQIEEKLQDTFDTVYESLDVPYAYYTVLKGKEATGYIHGVNQKGKYGVLQLVVATDLEGTILAFYYQKISSPEAGKFRDTAFTSQFKGLRFADFSGQGRVTKITDPSTSSPEDFKATLRGIKKDLILLDEFLHGQENKEGGKK
jgi:hypothetical protein